MRNAHESIEGSTSRADTVWVVFADSERDLEWLGSLSVPVRLTPSGLGSLKAVTEWVGSRGRDNVSRLAVTNYT